jgi:plasmid stabilization system protein ParE
MLSLQKAPHFLRDFELQFDWYVIHAGPYIAEAYATAVHQTVCLLGSNPGIGHLCKFKAPILRSLRFFRVYPPFNRHLLFYRFDESTLYIERVVAGDRDLPRRLTEPPGSSD